MLQRQLLHHYPSKRRMEQNIYKKSDPKSILYLVKRSSSQDFSFCVVSGVRPERTLCWWRSAKNSLGLRNEDSVGWTKKVSVERTKCWMNEENGWGTKKAFECLRDEESVWVSEERRKWLRNEESAWVFEGRRKCLSVWGTRKLRIERRNLFGNEESVWGSGDRSLAFYASPNQLHVARTKEVGKSTKNSLWISLATVQGKDIDQSELKLYWFTVTLVTVRWTHWQYEL